MLKLQICVNDGMPRSVPTAKIFTALISHLHPLRNNNTSLEAHTGWNTEIAEEVPGATAVWLCGQRAVLKPCGKTERKHSISFISIFNPRARSIFIQPSAQQRIYLKIHGARTSGTAFIERGPSVLEGWISRSRMRAGAAPR